MQELRESVPQALPIVLTSFDDDEALAEALAAGARAYLLKTVHGAEISDVVRAVASGRVRARRAHRHTPPGRPR